MVEENVLSEDDIQKVERLSHNVPEWFEDRLGLLYDQNYIQDWYSMENSWDEYVRLKYKQYLYNKMLQKKT